MNVNDCPWPINIDECCSETGVDPDTPDGAARVEQVIAQVSSMLSRLSGYTFGGCATVRPLDPCGECRTGCCASGDCIVLHNASAVSEVRVYGTIVESAEYHFDAARGTLCAVPPLQWPTRDPRSGLVGSLEVDVMVGAEPDAWALSVANQLACELLKSCAGEKCRIPSRATQVTSQGITINLSEDEIRYGLPEVWAWVMAVNPNRATRPAQILSPEARRARVLGSGYQSGRRPWR